MEKDIFDLNAIIEELDSEFDNDEVVEQPDEAPLDEGETVVNDGEEETETLEEEQNEEEPEVDDETNEDQVENEDVHKRNEAFRALREERDKLAASDKFIAEMADSYGLTKEQLMERFKADQAEKDAEKQGLSPEQYKRIQDMETRLKEVEETKSREIFNIKAEQMASKYSLKQDDMVNLFKEAGNLGLDIMNNPDLLEFVYRSVNYDKAITKGRQKQLETSKNRRKTSTGKTGTGSRNVEITQEQAWDKEIEEITKNLNL